MKTLALFLLLSTAALAQDIVNNTLYLVGEDIQKAELSNRETSQRFVLKEVYFGYYVHPLANAPKGTYTLSVFRNRKRYVSTVIDTVAYDPKPITYIDGYYYRKSTGKYITTAYATKAEVVALIERDQVDFITRNGRANILEVYQVKNGIKTLVYEQ